MTTPLDQIKEQLDRIERRLSEPQLGFSSGRTPIYCNRSKGGLWYKLEPNPTPGGDWVPQPIEANFLTCRLEGIVIKQVTRSKKGECDKFKLYVRGDRPYVLESGWSVVPREQSFAKGLVLAIASMSAEQLKRPITLNPHPGDEDGVMFCRVYQDGKSIYVERGDNPPWESLLEAAIGNLEAATGRSFRD